MAPCSSPAESGLARSTRAWVVASIGALGVIATACDRVPFTAPSGSAITISTASAALSTDTVPVVALVVEGAQSSSTGTTGTGGNNNSSTVTSGAGNPVHNGTVVDFSTTIGTIVPAEATTVNGKVTVNFVGNGQVGTAVITVTSGPAIKTAQITLSAPSGS